MASIFVFNRSNRSDDDEILLGTPDMAEAQSLERHVERCAMRYRLFSRRLIEQGKSVTQIKVLVYILLAVVLLSSKPAMEVFKTVLALF